RSRKALFDECLFERQVVFRHGTPSGEIGVQHSGVSSRKGEKVIKRRHRKWTMLSFNTHANAIKLET
ncbi:hypothetical protein, partial [Pseudomonas fulva]|uniref:hypothetical protein n=1 Tax=Pseudomonas fulva TaxID=47880 RepID=UPI002DB8057C